MHFNTKLQGNYSYCRTTSDLPRRAPTATVATVTTEEGPNTELGAGGDQVDVAATTSGEGGDGGNMPIRELPATVKPPARSMGKMAKEKKEMHSRFLDYLEQEDDPIDLLFNSMAARVKQDLPSSERYQVAHKLMGQLNEYIVSFNRQEVVANTFLNPGAQAVSVANIVAPPAPPPMQARVQPQQQQTRPQRGMGAQNNGQMTGPQIRQPPPPPLIPRMSVPAQHEPAPVMGALLPLLHDSNDEELLERQYSFDDI